MTNSKSCIRLLLTLALIAVCIFTIVFGWILIGLPKTAEKSFGKPSKSLSFLDRVELSGQLLLQKAALKTPVDAHGSSIPFMIRSGESTFSITTRLEEAGIILSSQALRNYLQYSGLDRSLQAGEYQLSPRQNALEVAWAMQDATPSHVRFRILPGWRLEEIASALPTSGLEISPQSFLSAADQSRINPPLAEQLPDGASLEGFLYPDSYRMPRKIDAETFIETLLANFELKVGDDLQEGFQSQGLSLFEAVTLASIVQRESVLEEEMPMIASVFLNRLAAGMRLETDPTVQYALGYDYKKKTWWKNPLSLEDLRVNSPYNTYLNLGFPPGPISNPGIKALEAVAFPSQTSYFYFRSACDGSGKHKFSETFEEHLLNACPE